VIRGDIPGQIERLKKEVEGDILVAGSAKLVRSLTEYGLVIFVDLQRGDGPRLHKHPYAEIFFAIEGESTFTDGSESRVVRGGEAVIAGPTSPISSSTPGRDGFVRSTSI
jgi:mannose-6-phosphate isomerase-like protein (cupin superfamily)